MYIKMDIQAQIAVLPKAFYLLHVSSNFPGRKSTPKFLLAEQSASSSEYCFLWKAAFSTL
jgi:hypothetical protein